MSSGEPGGVTRVSRGANDLPTSLASPARSNGGELPIHFLKGILPKPPGSHFRYCPCQRYNQMDNGVTIGILRKIDTARHRRRSWMGMNNGHFVPPSLPNPSMGLQETANVGLVASGGFCRGVEQRHIKGGPSVGPFDPPGQKAAALRR